jgi:hypothetical protein
MYGYEHDPRAWHTQSRRENSAHVSVRRIGVYVVT